MRVHRARIFLTCLLLLLGGVLAVVAAPGCSGQNIIYDCNQPAFNHRESSNGPHPGTLDGCCDEEACPCLCIDSAKYPCDGSTNFLPSNFKDCHPDADGGTDGGMSSCAGECVPALPGGGWLGPDLLWFGPDGTPAPACPSQAPIANTTLHADLDVPPAECPTCSCSPSEGTCAAPLHFTANYVGCGSTSATTTAFDAPASWDGTTCTTNDAVPAGVMCTKTSPSCIHSVTLSPPVLTDQGCEVSQTSPVGLGPASWKTAVLDCAGTGPAVTACNDPTLACVPSAPPSLGFRRCIYHEDQQACPASYPEPHLVYSSFDDQRTCSPCGCGASAGSSCKTDLAVFTDGQCQTSLFSDTLTSDNASACIDVPSGSALGSKTLTPPTYQPGTCVPSGGQPMGATILSGAATFCCLLGA